MTAWIGSTASHSSRAVVASPTSDRGDAEAAAGVVAVAADLDDQVVDRVELLLVAQVVDELDAGDLAVQVAVEVEQVGLEQRERLVVVERRAATERDGARQPRPGGAVVV